MRQEKTVVKLPYDPHLYMVTGVKGAQVTCQSGVKETKRSHEKIKIKETRPRHLENGAQTTNYRDIDLDMKEYRDINLSRHMGGCPCRTQE